MLTASIVAMISFLSQASSDPAIWRVEPDTCLVSESETRCFMRVSITLLSLSVGKVCIIANKQVLTCMYEGQKSVTVDITLTSDTTLHLNDTNGKRLAEHTLVFNKLLDADFSQRTRLPWSLF
ncbi:DUF3019 domain-containing protein [Alteromonas sediminis]|uniref:DUF3019 domain-containing protein n=1 Tax=Alteromonas sediminis TaxID=2259342 RepID=A0A3N5Y5R0_9ALTE|nr:DUF3019 domain-containing protein [Alteromonas sediminis]RPJ65589.1 DUF3019 domain-containing protein [Alteromonas sediminis]